MSSGCSEDIIQSEFIHILPDHETELRNHLCRQWQENQFCDVTISLKEGEVRAHSCVLAAFSPRLKVMLNNLNPTPDAVNEHFIPLTFQERVFQCLLNMMYTGILSFSAAMLSSVLSTARWLQMDDVVKLCQEYEEVVGSSCKLAEDSVLTEVNIEDIKEEEDFFHHTRSHGNMLETKASPRKQKRQGKRGGTSKVASPSSKSKKSNIPSPVTIKVELDTEINEIVSEITNFSDPVSMRTDEISKKVGSPKQRRTRPKTKTALKQKKNCEPTKAKKKQRPSKSQKTKAATPDVPKVKVEIPSQEENADRSFTDHTPVLPAQWVETEESNSNDKAEADFTMGKTDHIRCKKCLVKFTELDRYLSHVTDHPVFKCDHCDITYYRLSNLTRHMRTSHSTDHHLQCQKCDFEAGTETALRNHFKEVHGGDKPFICDHSGCTYSSWKFEFLKRHSEIHSSVKQYICNKCSQGFSQYAGLMSHKRTCYHLQQFLCDLCGQAFNHIQSMRAHRRTIHFGEKPYLCKVCGNQFGDQRNLKRHMRIHDNSFPYQCPQCQQNYRHSNSLKAHLKKHEKEGLKFDINLIVRKESGQRKQDANHSEQRTDNPEKQSCNRSDFAVGSDSDKDFLSESEQRVHSVTETVFPGQMISTNSPQPSDRCSVTTAASCSSSEVTPCIGSMDCVVVGKGKDMQEGLFTTVPLHVSDQTIELDTADGMNPILHQSSASSTQTTSDSILIDSCFDSSESKLASLITPAHDGTAIVKVELVSADNSEATQPIHCSEAVPTSDTLNDSGKTVEKNADRGEAVSDTKFNGQSSYGLQTLAEICFSSSV